MLGCFFTNNYSSKSQPVDNTFKIRLYKDSLNNKEYLISVE